MTLPHLLTAAVAVLVWFLGWRWALGRMKLSAEGARPGVEAAEAILLTMFAALWFASLGHGGWWVLFGVLGLLIEGPVGLRHRGALPPETAAWRPLVLGVIRLAGAGALLALLL